jgi:predicted alpha/beta-hydrolase family hydrolase
MLLAPGAGSSAGHPSLVAVDRAVSDLGVTVQRMDFAYRLAGRTRPDPQALLEQAVRDAAAGLAARLGVQAHDLILGGRSMGGRICSQVVAHGLPAAGLVLISYPLHPPGRLERARTSHLPSLRLPCLFISGTRDAFATAEELAAATRAIHGPVTHAWVEGGDHGLRGKDEEVALRVAAWVRKQLDGR